MNSATLIAANFLRENRWPVLLLMIWAIASGVAAALTVGGMSSDSLFFLQQQAAYSIFFTVFLAASALNNQRRSRRILAVLSKGIRRSEYLAGIALGFIGVGAMYSLVLGVMGAWTFSRVHAPAHSMLWLVLMLFLAIALAGTMALFFSTFVNPLLSVVFTSVVLGLPALLPNTLGAAIPAYHLTHRVMEMNFEAGVQPLWTAMGIALVEAIVLWMLASLVFATKDIAVPVE
jgi:hypothetical protein